MRVAALLAAVLVFAGGAFFVGRATASHHSAAAVAKPHPGSYEDGYRAGHEDAFSGYDGGWVLGDPYIVTLQRGGPGITYAFARRWPVEPGREYRACDQDIICSRPAQ